MNAMTPMDTAQDPRWKAVVARDRAADGTFYYSVKTTGVYCRPSCAARLARPENVRFHATRTAAEKAGFRPCKRCKPDQASLSAQHAEMVAKACRIITGAESVPVLADLAAQVGMSAYHFHRLFKRATGVTPRAYAAAQRETRVRSALAKGGSVTAAIFDAGYNASSRFYEKSNALLGMTPSAYKAGGADMDITFAVGESSLGAVLVAHSTKGICAIFMGDDADALILDLRRRFPRAAISHGGQGFAKSVADVVRMVDKPGLGLDLPLDVRGTAFQKRVWQALQKIPAGTTASYTDIARHIGKPKSVRAVGQACGANPLAVVIPCHRVVRGDGDLAGYRWGVERKRALLKAEASARPSSKPARRK
ncbi:MAG: bifunctional DNA-binding transcriptional regulator/O6-methylguanine-DNA methyltransferase Ada [Rhodospirillaceae bacterium]|nr:bifunctional DNA-binding transcriptional regulator/O6-methylguanine-DNA methyltransferase Ada [Rhodospirillaceae bacterium]